MRLLQRAGDMGVHTVRSGSWVQSECYQHVIPNSTVVQVTVLLPQKAATRLCNTSSPE